MITQQDEEYLSIKSDEMATFLRMDEDVLIHVVSFLEHPEIQVLSQTCKLLHQLCSLRIVWTNACKYHILSKGYPFPLLSLDRMSTQDLKYHAYHAYYLAKRWLSGIQKPKRIRHINGTSGTSVSDTQFLPGHGGKLLLTVAKSVWSVLAIWDIMNDAKVCEWSPRGAIFTGFAVNQAEESTATVAISLQLDEEHLIKILRLEQDAGKYFLQEICSFKSGMMPISLVGDLLALADVVSKTAIWNWRTGNYAILEHTNTEASTLQSNDCVQVVFAHESVLVVRARSIHLFPFPDLERPHPRGKQPTTYKPVAHHSFGWVDGECVAICPFIYPTPTKTSKAAWLPLSILVRGESDDPWATDIYYLELYTLEPNPDYSKETGAHDQASRDDISGQTPDIRLLASPYFFPPHLTNKVACLRGSLRCKGVFLGRFGTAIWIQPRDRFIGGLLADIPANFVPSSNAHESLVVAAFPGSLNSGAGADGKLTTTSVVVGKKIFQNQSNTSWTSFDYDEIGGRIVLGSSFGRVTVLYI